ncbi:MAG: hypothetical protein M3437_01860 [Chloroflexota bacterium]|nr:hypothetical protein [Chloroflexota bacterium]MDQ5866318.1 hypothetical protein [Chloroflexota bacterium]
MTKYPTSSPINSAADYQPGVNIVDQEEIRLAADHTSEHAAELTLQAATPLAGSDPIINHNDPNPEQHPHRAHPHHDAPPEPLEHSDSDHDSQHDHSEHDHEHHEHHSHHSHNQEAHREHHSHHLHYEHDHRDEIQIRGYHSSAPGG